MNAELFVLQGKDVLAIRVPRGRANPGGLPEGLRLSNLLVTPPRPRNPLLADALKRAGIVERTARGVDAVFADQIRLGRSIPRYQADAQVGVTLTLSRARAGLVLRAAAGRGGTPQRRSAAAGLLLLDQLWRAGDIDVAEAAMLTQRSEGDAADAADALVRRGLCGSAHGRAGRRWRLAAAAAP